MTAQISDTIRFRDHEYDIAGISGTRLFDPLDHGLFPRPVSTACWRGFYCTYHVTKGHLYLREAHLNLDEYFTFRLRPRTGPRLLGPTVQRYWLRWLRPGAWVRAVIGVAFLLGYRLRREDLKAARHQWKNFQQMVSNPLLADPVPFTGGLLIGRDFIEELYEHMGFHPASTYRTVYELIFEQGRLTEAVNQSAVMSEYRQRTAQLLTRPPRGATQEELMAWIEQRFRQDYER